MSIHARLVLHGRALALTMRHMPYTVSGLLPGEPVMPTTRFTPHPFTTASMALNLWLDGLPTWVSSSMATAPVRPSSTALQKASFSMRMLS